MLVGVDRPCSDQLIRSFFAGDAAVIGVLVERADTSDDPAVLVAAAHLRGDTDRALPLARDHLAEHPDSLLVAHIAATCTDSRETRYHP